MYKYKQERKELVEKLEKVRGRGIRKERERGEYG